MSQLPICTVGHSNRTLAEFAALLGTAQVQQVVDIRSVARSRHNPQFNHDVIGGGLRGKSKTVLPEVNAYWTHPSFHNYADYALSAAFRTGLQRLLELGAQRRCAIMCAEAVWWRCHRRIVADYLLQAGREVLHLMGEHRIEPARMTEAAVPAPDGLHYPKPGGGP